MAGEPLRGEAVCFRFLSSALVGVADLGTGDLPLSFLDPVMRKALVNSSSLRSGSSDSLSELLELSSDPGKYLIKFFLRKSKKNVCHELQMNSNFGLNTFKEDSKKNFKCAIEFCFPSFHVRNEIKYCFIGPQPTYS